ncbi:MAG: MMPL family transporter [Thermomicrobiales bacterium]|nr:MMPL family transporter [Thermomicrobiales bacterium]
MATSTEPHVNHVAPGVHHPPGPPVHPLGHVARWVTEHSKLVIIAWVVLILAAAPLALTVNGVLSGAGWDAAGSESARVRDEIGATFPDFFIENAIVVYQQETPIADDPSGLAALVTALGSAPATTGLIDPLALPADSGMISPDGRTAMVQVRLAGEVDADFPEAAGEVIAYVQGLPVPAGAQIEVTGEWPVWNEFNKSNEEALHKAELLSAGPSLLLLLIAFGAAIAAGVPLLLAVAGIAFGFATLHLLGMTMPLSIWAMNFSMMIGLAVGIDYSLFIISRYRQERAKGRAAGPAIETALSTTGFAVLLSGLAVVFSLAVIFIVPVMVFRSMALGMILAVLAVAFGSVTLLPAVLVALGDRVLKKGATEESEARRFCLFHRPANAALRRPALALVAGLLLIGALIVPVFGMQLGMPDGRVVETGRTSRDGYELVTAAFGEGVAGPILVTVDAGEADAVVTSAMGFEQAIGAQVVTPPNEAGRVIVQVVPANGPSTTETMDLVSGLRTEVQGAAPSALVGGPAAQNHDLTEVLSNRFPYAVALIMLGAMAMLLVVFRSVWIALGAVVLNLLSVGAAFGFATLLFQKGWGAGLLGIDYQGFVNAWAPIFFFALLFGLSMDYQLFLLASIRERYEATGDTRLAVLEGSQQARRPIMNAALIMIVVFIAFGMTGPIPPTELGLTLAFSVLLVAAVVLMFVLPAAILLLGDRTWWLPEWIEKRLPNIEFNH